APFDTFSPRFAFLLALSSPLSFFSFTATSTPAIYTLSLHDALPISWVVMDPRSPLPPWTHWPPPGSVTPIFTSPRCAPLPGLHRSEEHTSELQSRFDLVCRLLLEKKKTQNQ